MESLYAWIRSIVFYVIFMTLVTSLLPGKGYDRYFRLFTGMVLVLLVVSPLTGSLRLDERLAYYFEAISFQSEAGELRGQMEEIERARLENIIEEYEEAASKDVEGRLEAEGCRGVEAKVEINGDEESGRFGTIERVRIRMEERGGEGQEAQESGGRLSGEEGNGGRDTENRIDPEIKIGLPEISLSGQEGEGSLAPVPGPSVRPAGEENGGAGPLSSQASAPGAAGNREAERIRKEIAEFYGLEESHIEIQFKGGKAGP